MSGTFCLCNGIIKIILSSFKILVDGHFGVESHSLRGCILIINYILSFMYCCLD